MQLHDIILVIIAFFSELVGTISGFGSSTFFVPLALFLESAQFVLALTAILHCFGNLSKIIIFRKYFEWKIFFVLSIPFILFAGIGALLVAQYQTQYMQPALGATLAIYALFSLLRPKRPLRFPMWVSVMLSGVSGLSTGFVGTGGAIRGIALSTLGMPKNTFVVVSSAIDIGGDLLRAGIYLINGFMNWSQWFYIPLLAISGYAGAKVGFFCLRRVNQDQFEKSVSVFVLISGLVMLWEVIR